jgi:integrase
MLANSFCRDSAPADSSDKSYFRRFRTMHASPMLREDARPEIVRDNMGHANIDVTQIVYGKS